MPIDNHQQERKHNYMFYIVFKDITGQLWMSLDIAENGRLDAPKGKVSGSNPDGGASRLSRLLVLSFSPTYACVVTGGADDMKS